MKHTFEELERIAMRGDPMPDGLRLYEQAGFQALRSLYKLYRLKGIVKEDASKEKGMIRAAYQRQEADFEAGREYMLFHAKFFKEIESAANRYGKERTLEAADAFHEAVYGCRLEEK